MKKDIIKLRLEGKSYNEIVSILGCSKGTVSYHCSKLENHTYSTKNKSDDLIKNIIKLYNEGFSANKVSLFLGISKTTVMKHVDLRANLTDDEIKIRKYNIVKNRRIQNKKLLVEYKGGKCQNCGYNKCIGALEFHHRNPLEKEFGLSAKGLNKSYSVLKKEVDKCDLLCANCHRELHWL